MHATRSLWSSFSKLATLWTSNTELTSGYQSYFLVPLTIAIGRRPVLLATGAMAWSGGLWAGYSTSLDSHLAARAFQGLGAGAVEVLVSTRR